MTGTDADVEAALAALVAQALELVKAHNEANPDAAIAVDLDMESIKAEGAYVPEPEAPVEEEEEEQAGSDYYITDNSVVSVTYGDIDANGHKTAYKTFILNYNNFAVRVTYGGVVYTVAANGYVVVPVQN